MASITIDGLDEEVFRRNIEAMLRVGEADRAALKLRALLEPYAGEGRILPARFLEVSAADFRLEGWEHLGECLARNDSPRNPISALTIAVSDAEAMGLNEAEAGDAAPLIATSHFTDEAYMFSKCGVSDLLDGYSFYGCEWHGSSAHMDTALTLGGVEDLYRAVTAIEGELIASPQPALDMIRAGALASCFLAVLLFQAVRDTIRARGLPRPLCVMAGNEGVYPYFDAPVIGSAECAEQGLVQGRSAAPVHSAAPLADLDGDDEAEADAPDHADADGIAYGRLSELTGRKGEKKMVLELAEADVRTAAELLDRAGEDRMLGEGRAAPEDLLAHRGPSHPLFPLDLPPPPPAADLPPISAPAPTSASASPPLPEPVGLDPFASVGSFPELAEDGFPQTPALRPRRAEPLSDLARSDLARSDLAPMDRAPESAPAPEPDYVLAAEPDSGPVLVLEPARPLQSHSLRARFADTPPPPPPPPSGLAAARAALGRWLRRLFG